MSTHRIATCVAFPTAGAVMRDLGFNLDQLGAVMLDLDLKCYSMCLTSTLLPSCIQASPDIAVKQRHPQCHNTHHVSIAFLGSLSALML